MRVDRCDGGDQLAGYDLGRVIIPIADRKGGAPRSIRRFTPRRQPNIPKGAKSVPEIMNPCWDLFAKESARQWQAELRIPVGVRSHSTGELTINEALAGNEMISGVFTLPPLAGKGILQLDRTIGMMIIERHLGGQASSHQKPRALTEFDLSIMQSEFKNLLAVMKASCADLAPFSTEIAPIVSDVSLLPPLADLPARVHCRTFLVTMKDYEGIMRLLFLPELLQELAAPAMMRGSEDQSMVFSPRTFLKRMAGMPIPVSAELGSVEITLSELRKLRKDNIIVLEKSVSEEIDVKLHDTVKLKGRIGKRGELRAVEITGVIGEEEWQQ